MPETYLIIFRDTELRCQVEFCPPHKLAQRKLAGIPDPLGRGGIATGDSPIIYDTSPKSHVLRYN